MNKTLHMNGKQFISRELEHFYNRVSEETRLEKGMGIFEFIRIKSLIEKFILCDQQTIIDVGGGTGKYAEWLAQKGHRVHLIEPLEKHLAIAEKRSRKLKNKFTIHQAEARNIPLQNHIADIVILHGPLYHLQHSEDRSRAILEAKRLLKNGGIVLGFAINYTASTLVGLLQGQIHKRPFFNMCVEELKSGVHNPPEGFSYLLAEAYYHKPSELKLEFVTQGFEYLNTYAVESIAWLDKDYFMNMTIEKKRHTLNKLTELIENDSELMAFSPHMMIAAKK